jgi:hypothetical protein
VDTWKGSRGRTNKVKVLLFSGLCVGSLNGGKQAWVGRARTADARFLRSIIDRCVSLLDLIAPPLAPLSLVFSHILCFKTPFPYVHILHTLHTNSPLGLATTAHPGLSRLVPPPIPPPPASTKSSGRGLHQPLSLRLS